MSSSERTSAVRESEVRNVRRDQLKCDSGGAADRFELVTGTCVCYDIFERWTLHSGRLITEYSGDEEHEQLILNHV